jgi:alpha(1,3/1,4) fucosyltransferase
VYLNNSMSQFDIKAKVGLIPIYKNLVNDLIFNKSFCEKDDNLNMPLFVIKKILNDNGFALQTCSREDISQFDMFILYRLELKLILILYLKRKLKQTIYIPLENEVIEFFHKSIYLKIFAYIFRNVITWNDSVIGNNILHCPLSVYFKDFTKPVQFENKEFLTMVSGYKKSNSVGELYSERFKIISYYELINLSGFTFYGRGWQNCGFKNYGGEIEVKINIISRYKFCICFENMISDNGYISEKIFHCFFANCVPIYYGCKNLNKYIPPSCYIDYSDFCSIQELDSFLRNMKKNEYESYIDSINKFIKSEEFKIFLPQYSAKIILFCLEGNSYRMSWIMQLISLFYFSFIKTFKRFF